MAQLKISHNGFTLTSKWFVYEDDYENMEITEGPSYGYQTVTFDYSLPTGAEVKGAKVHATWSYPSTGFYWRGINGTNPDSDGMVDVEIDPSLKSIDVLFSFRAKGHTNATGDQSDSTTVSDVYLLIEYTYGGILYRTVSGGLVPYRFYHAENGALVPYRLFCRPGDKLYTVDGEQLYTAEGYTVRVLGE